jgi:Tfp pilus assembly protein PilO
MIDHLPLWQQILITILLLLIVGMILKKLGWKLRSDPILEESDTDEKKRGDRR